MANAHSNKHIRESVKYAESRGWRLTASRGESCVALLDILNARFQYGPHRECPRIMHRTFDVVWTDAPESEVVCRHPFVLEDVT